MVGLLVFEPNLKLMILTKENVAAQAFAEQIFVGSRGVVLACDGSEGALTWCFFVFVCFSPEDNHCVENQFRLFSCSVFCFSLALSSLREDWRTV